MKKEIMAANVIGIANLYNLQLFSDEEFETSTEEVTETEPNTEEVANSEVEETQEEVQEDPKEDITQTQAFSRRLNAEREKIRKEAEEQAIDRYIAKQYEGQLWKGKPITSQAELNQALYEQQLEQAGQSPEAIQKLIDEHPDVKAAREARVKADQGQKLLREWEELTEEHKNIKDFKDVPPEVYELAESKKIPLLDAFNRIHIKKVKLETEQETIRKINKNATSSPGSVSNGNVVHKTKAVADMTAEEFEAYREEVRKQRRD